MFQDIYDGWYGLSWARDVNGFGMGVSLFFSSVSYRQRIETKDMVLASPPEAGALSEYLYYNFACRRLVAKGGVTWTSGPVSLGATVTLPSVRLPWSSGEMSVGRNLVYVDTTLTGQIGSSRQEDLDANYKDPPSFAAGAQLTAGSFDFYASGQWFGPVDAYDVLETQPIESQVPVQSYDLLIMQQRESVFNIGGGVSMRATKWLSLFASARTDKSYRDPDIRTFVGLGAYDLTHVTAGVGVSGESFEVVLGGLYASGDANSEVLLSPLPASPAVPSKTDFSEKGFVLAFSANF
jgi:hypothetical protein